MESVSEPTRLRASEGEPPKRAEPDENPGPARAAFRGRRVRAWTDAVYVLTLATCAVLFLLMRKVHELTYPAPWPDEGSFLWPALAFRDHASLYAPELFPTREVFWMPPGFMVLEGIIFKIWTFSLGRARLLSALFLLGALACVAMILRRSRVRVGQAFILGIFLFSPIFQLAGNTARMEGLLLFVGSAGFLCLDRKRWAGIGVLAFGPLVHPVGLLFVAMGCAYWFIAVRDGRRLERVDRVVLGFALFCWLAYAAHVIPNFRTVYEDMAGQLKFKEYVSAANGGIGGRILQPLVFASFIASATAVWAAVRFAAPTATLGALSLATMLAATLTEGWLYDIYPAFGALLASVGLLECGAFYLARRRPNSNQLGMGIKLALMTAVVLFVDAKWIVLNSHIMRSVQSSTASTWSADPRYVSDEERRQVAEFLRSITPKKGRITVQFLPDADALIFEEIRSPTLGFVQQTFYETKPDVFIYHRSPWFPPLVYDLELIGFALHHGAIEPVDRWPVITHGLSGSRWQVVRKLPGKIDWH